MVKGYLPVLHIMGKESPASMGALDGNLRKVQAGSDPADTTQKIVRGGGI